MPVTLNNGHKMSSWYDIKALDTKTDHDEEGILSSSIKIKAIIESESKLVGYNRIILAGFSQGLFIYSIILIYFLGAVMTMATAFKLPHKLGGIMCLSGYMPYPDKFQSFMVDENLEGLFMAHGTDDQVVKYKWGKDSFEKLESFGVKGVFKMYPGMGHGSCSKEVSDILSYLKQRLEQRHEL